MRRWWGYVLALAGLVAPAVPRPADAALEPESSRLDALIVGDTADPEVGKSVAIDVEGMQAALRAGVPAGKLRLTVLGGAEAVPERVLAHYAALPTASDETFLFYWSGHGAWSDQGQYLRMHEERILERGLLLRAMQAKGPRLAVLLTDCCSVYVGKTALFAPPAPDPDVFRDLFFRHRGVVDVTAAQKGQEAVGDQFLGGLFTNALVQALMVTPREQLDARRDGILTWDEVAAEVARQTAAAFRRSHPRGLVIQGRKVPGQNPHVFGVGTPPAAPIAPSARLGLTTRSAGATLVVTAVAEGSPSAWIELRPGDRVLSLRLTGPGGEERTFELRTPEDLARALEAAGGSRLVALSVGRARGDEVEERWVRLGP